MTINEFIVSRYYQQPIRKDEDECQDPAECRRLLKKDQEEKYAIFVAQHEPKDVSQHGTSEEDRVNDRLQQITGQDKKVLRNSDNGATKSRAEYFRLYRKQKKCRHCGKLNP